MKRLILFSLALTTLLCSAQTVSFKATTGDKEFDLSLSELNTGGKEDPKGFKAEMNLSFNCGNQAVDELLVKVGGEPANVFMVLQLASQLNKSHDVILASFNRHKGKGGWGAVTKELGVKPGSPEFHAMKNNAKGKNGNMKGRKAKGNPGNGNGNGKK